MYLRWFYRTAQCALSNIPIKHIIGFIVTCIAVVSGFICFLLKFKKIVDLRMSEVMDIGGMQDAAKKRRERLMAARAKVGNSYAACKKL